MYRVVVERLLRGPQKIAHSMCDFAYGCIASNLKQQFLGLQPVASPLMPQLCGSEVHDWRIAPVRFRVSTRLPIRLELLRLSRAQCDIVANGIKKKKDRAENEDIP